ncbi:MAG TPA: DUF4241 domain-containing protein [Ktedonobacterales bacterium]|jgi:hypothetical protein
MSPPDYNKAFHDGVIIKVDTGAVAKHCTLHRRPLGELVVTSGRIVVRDPLVVPDMPPLADPAEPGRYPVVLSVAELPNGDQRVACALLQLSEHLAVRWEMATRHGQTLSSLEPGYIFGYPVDAGTGCFMDADTSRALIARPIHMGNGYVESDELLDTLNRTYLPTWCWANLILDDASGANVIAFSSGWGDGFYPSYWGYDAASQRVALVADFGVLGESWEEGGARQLSLFDEK